MPEPNDNPIQSQIDRRIAAEEHAREEAADRIEDRLDKLETKFPRTQDYTAEQVKEFIEAVLREQGKARQVADEEREKSAEVLRHGLSEQVSQGLSLIHI